MTIYVTGVILHEIVILTRPFGGQIMKIFLFLFFLFTIVSGIISILDSSLTINTLGFWAIVGAILMSGIWWRLDSPAEKRVDAPPEDKQVLSSKLEGEKL